jgi:hypothetical protein
MTKSILQTPESHAGANFHFLWTGNESWLFSEEMHTIIKSVGSVVGGSG